MNVKIQTTVLHFSPENVFDQSKVQRQILNLKILIQLVVGKLFAPWSSNTSDGGDSYLSPKGVRSGEG